MDITLSHILWDSSLGLKLRTSYFKAAPLDHGNPRETHFGESIAGHISKHGGRAILTFKVARLIGCLVLLGLSSAAVAVDDEKSQSPESRTNPHIYLQSAMCGTYFYAAGLAILSISANPKWNRIAARHLDALLLCNFGVYSYRDVFPLATFILSPMDLWEGWVLWPKIIVLFAVSGIIPLVIPRKYTPLNPKKPMPVPNPEQIASVLSSVLYFFLDPIIFLASRIPHLSFDQLPPLCDYDYAEDLKIKAFPYMDAFVSGKQRHIFFGLIWFFRWEFLSMAVLLAVAALSNFISPLAINRLLNYLENPNGEYFMKPWFWVFLLFVGPITYALTFQWDIFIGTHIMAQATAIITQLVFEHALRIRVKTETQDKGDATTKTPSEKASANLLGKINNLCTIDLGRINETRNILFLVVLVPIQVIGSIIFLYQILGWSAFVGVGVMVALVPLPGYVAKLQSSVQEKALQKTDARVQTVSETMNVIRMIKMFGWEKQIHEKIAEQQEQELTWIWWRKVLYTAQAVLKLVSYICLLSLGSSSITVIMGQELSASKVFSAKAVFDLLQSQLWFAQYCTSMGVNTKVSLDCLQDFITNTELLDSYTPKNVAQLVIPDEPVSDMIGFRDTVFSWSDDDENDGTLTPSSRRFLLKIEGELLFKPGCINLVIGPTGSGKTSLLMALLGEMHRLPSSASSWFNLPREKGVSYAAQESWVMNDTIKNNILFNAPMDPERYKKVLYQCCLERDLELFDAGDETEVGEKGLTLSGGQKARVTLARAIYADSRIILADDVLAALDIHTAKWIVDKCLRGDLIKNRTVILVTHNVAMTRKIADVVVSVGSDGRVQSQASISDALAEDEALAEEVSKDQVVLEMAETQIDLAPSADEPKKMDGKLVLAEEIEIGRVSWSALNMFFTGMGGDHAVLFFVVLLIVMIVVEVAVRVETWYLGYWGRYKLSTIIIANISRYLGFFSLLVLVETLVTCTAYVYFSLGSFRASQSIHAQLLQSIFGTTFRWLDVTPISRIIARCTGDMDTVDDPLSEGFWDLMANTFAMLTRFLAVILFTPLFFFPGLLVGFVGAWCGKIYMASQLSVKREMSNAKAPVLGHIGATMAGLASVRAFGAQETQIQISLNKINRLTRVSRTFANLNRWAIVRIGTFSSFKAALLTYYLVYFQNQSPANIGFSLNMALGFSNGILNWVRLMNQFEVQSNSLERIKQYITIEQEPKATPSGIPPAYWPASGEINVVNLSARYSPEGPRVLHGISFNIKSGERVGLVGRTGSGKSSLTLALLRCIFTDGAVYYDGIPTSSLNLDTLRANVTIIPQAPELLAGSLRSNLDMLGQSDDAALNEALRAAGLTSLQEDMEDGKLTLDSEIAAGGNNLSVGQRQIIALARAIIRGSKLSILDEGTHVLLRTDYKTDAVIQSSLRTELPRDTTILTVAHRLHTVMDADKIMVLDAGRIVEFGSPKALLKDKHGMLRVLVDESGDKDALYKMAEA
ncbi:hypothetical protein DFH07DRAFT_760895 [Mycena maculata]|uniref:P-loop containing nucleoside triphosphate hydrolase protein n=1 Tax=Mycena maculata TaxID=230809 RepID=A0AAD7HGI7_9AGAR|nr:hypothetical protein DFH07DRAFT_760895 [Mycena maculata]